MAKPNGILKISVRLSFGLVLIILFCERSLAKDEWLCTEESSQLRNGAVLSCGVAEGANENEARSKAFEFAKAEFARVCHASANCVGHKFTVEPKRTTCKPEKSGYKCYRLLEFTISSDMEYADQTDGKAAKIVKAQFTGDKPKLRKGMKKSQVLEAFGEPVKVDSLTFTYESPVFCQKSYSKHYCSIQFYESVVYSWYGFLPGYTTDLDDAPDPVIPKAPANQKKTKQIKLPYKQELTVKMFSPKTDSAITTIANKNLCGHWTERCATHVAKTCEGRGFVDISLSCDGTYLEMYRSKDGFVSFEGKWSSSDEAIILNITSVNNQSIKKMSQTYFYSQSAVSIKAYGWEAKRQLKLKPLSSTEYTIELLDDIEKVITAGGP